MLMGAPGDEPRRACVEVLGTPPEAPEFLAGSAEVVLYFDFPRATDTVRVEVRLARK